MLTFDAMTRLDNSYCVPNTEDEWSAIDALNPRIELRMKGAFVYTLKEHGKRRLWVCHREKGNAKEIPVSKFLDLYHDRIAPWRLEEVGFEHGHELKLAHCNVLFWSGDGDDIDIDKDGSLIPVNITTFTELLTLIRFLTPPSNG